MRRRTRQGKGVAMTTPVKRVLRDPRDGLRNAVSNVEEQLALGECSSALRAAWATLVNTLALGPAPALRECPSCGQVGRSAATLCGYCWIRLPPSAESA